MTRAAPLLAVHACGERLRAALAAGDVDGALGLVRERAALVEALRAAAPTGGLTPDERVAAAALAAQGRALLDAAGAAHAGLDRAREALAQERRARTRYDAPAAPGPNRVALDG